MHVGEAPFDNLTASKQSTWKQQIYVHPVINIQSRENTIVIT